MILLLKFHQFYSAKNTRRDTHKTLKNHIFRNWRQQKPILFHRKPLKTQKQIEENNFRNVFKTFFDEGLR